jgi:hypothetical protein
LIRKKRPFDGFIGWIMSLKYSRIGFIFNFKAVFIFRFLNLNAQPVYLWGAHASGSLHVPVSKGLSGKWGNTRAAQREGASRGALLQERPKLPLEHQYRPMLPKDIPAEHINLKISI